jgi:hypothetical protein
VAATCRNVSSACAMRAAVHGACHAALVRSSRTSTGANPSSSQARKAGRNDAWTSAYTRCSLRSHVAVSGSVAPFTNADEPSAHVTSQRAAPLYPPAIGCHLAMG